jgi:hypothetical protein
LGDAQRFVQWRGGQRPGAKKRDQRSLVRSTP